MVNDCIRIGLANDVSSLRKLSLLSYNQLALRFPQLLQALRHIERAVILSSKKSLKRGFPTRQPYAVRHQLVSCYGLKIKNEGLEIPVSRGKCLSIPLTKHTLDVISQPGSGFALSPSPGTAYASASPVTLPV